MRKAEHPVLGTMSSVFAKDKSYVTTTDEGTGKPTLFIQIGESMSKKHAMLLSELITLSCKKKFTKEQAVAWRDKKVAEGA